MTRTDLPAVTPLPCDPLVSLPQSVVRALLTAATLDGPTGVLTAQAWRLHAARSLHAARPGDHRALLVVDLDHFKRVNDRYGHLAGDAVLVAIVETIRAELRADDLVGRWGGDEFVALLALPTGTCSAGAVAERIRQRIEALCVRVEGPVGPVTVADLTVSIGAALHDGTARSGAPVPTGLLWAADQALYAAKHAGRNGVRLYPVGERP